MHDLQGQQVERKCKNGAYQCLCPWRESQQAPCSSSRCLKLAIEFPSHIVQALLLSCWALGEVSLCLSPFRAASQFPKPFGFQRQTFWGLVSLMQVPSVGVSQAQTSCFSERSPGFVRFILIVRCGARGRVLGEITSLPLPPVSMWSIYHLRWHYSASFQVFFQLFNLQMQIWYVHGRR